MVWLARICEQLLHWMLYVFSWLELSETGSPNEFYCGSILNNNELSQLTASSTVVFRALQASTSLVHPSAQVRQNPSRF